MLFKSVSSYLLKDVRFVRKYGVIYKLYSKDRDVILEIGPMELNSFYDELKEFLNTNWYQRVTDEYIEYIPYRA
jgi:hypothetical protein